MLCTPMDAIPVCRVCLKASLKYIDFETPMETLPSKDFSNASKSFITYWDCFRACTQLELTTHEEHMPHNLCDECGIELGIAYNFLQKALHADKVLNETASKVKNKSATNLCEADINKANKTGKTTLKHDLPLELKSEELIKRKHQNNGMEAVLPDKNLLITDTNSNNNEEHSDNGVFMYICPICDTYFNETAELNLHLRQQHNEIAIEDYDFHSVSAHELEERKLTTDQLILSNEEQLLNASTCQPSQLATDKEYYVFEFLEVTHDDEMYDTESRLAYENEDTGELGEVENLSNNTSTEVNVNTDKPMDKHNDNDTHFNCRGCTQSFSTQRLLLQHWRTQHSTPAQSTKCKICQQHISKSESMRQHMQQSHSAIVQCSRCDHRCKELKLAAHEQRAHAERLDYSCDICSKKFSTPSMLKSHIKYHQRKQANIKSDGCEICGKQFSTKHYLRQHMEMHRKERQLHQCNQCDKVYITKTALDNHMRLHKGETIICEECGKHFVRQYELNVHMRFHKREYPFQCEICDKKFAIKGHLRTHMWRHQGLKLQCEDCGKLFTSTKALQEHSFVHTEMPYPCCYCGRAYPSKQKYKVHLKTTHLLELTKEELEKVQKNQIPKPLQRKKLTLVQADSVMKEVEVKDENEEAVSENIEEILVELC